MHPLRPVPRRHPDRVRRGSGGARLVLIGEQPGDKEDLEGARSSAPPAAARPGARGRRHRPRRVYVTNAVKHFKWKRAGQGAPAPEAERRGGARVPTGGGAELDAVDPELVVLLGATAAQAVLGPRVRVTRDRGVVIPAGDGSRTTRSSPSIRQPCCACARRSATSPSTSSYGTSRRRGATSVRESRTRRGPGRLLGVGVPGLARAVYPTELPQRRWFEHYADAFRHRRAEHHLLPTAARERGRAVGRAGATRVRLRVKLGQFGSHRMKLRDAGVVAAEPPRPVRRLGPALGPDPRAAPAALAAQRRAARRVPRRSRRRSMRWAVEVRDPSWLHDDVFEVLERHGAALCIHDLLADHPWMLHHRLDVRALPRARRASRRSTTVATAGAGCGAPADRLAPWLERGRRRVRLLQQRLPRRRGAMTPSGSGLASTAGARSRCRNRQSDERVPRRAGSVTTRGSRASGPSVGVSSIAISLPSPSGRTWMSTTATPAGRNLTSSLMRRGGSRSRSCSSP